MSRPMGHGELLKDLQEKGAAQVKTLWAAAEATAAKRRSELEAVLVSEKDKYAAQQRQSFEEHRTSIIMAAHKKADQILILAQKDLADRLFEQARQMLPELRSGDHGNLFTALAKELPAEHWEEVRVNPQDVKMASLSFPEASIISDDRITGGFAAMTDDGLEVVNTLDKRLERAWESMVPDLLAHLDKQETMA